MARFLLYSHDSYGLGHLRRSTLLGDAIVAADPDNDVLIATGSPRAQAFPLPDGVDTLTLPSATKGPDGTYVPRRLTCSTAALVRLRSAVISAAVQAFEPDVIVVDHTPIGLAGELIPVLEQARRRAHPPRLVLGLRDIIDDAAEVDSAWCRSDVWTWLRCYDDVLVYGDDRILTTATELGLADRLDAAVTHTGYVAPTMPRAQRCEPFLLVTPGGGGDGQAMLRRYLDGVEAGATGDLRSVVVTGPLMSSSGREELVDRARRLSSVELVEFTSEMRTLIASAAGVVSMAGYNTVVEELSAGVSALLVPRVRPRLEQDIRARRLAPRSQLRYCPLDRLDVDAIARFAAEAPAERSGGRSTAVDLGGATATAAVVAGRCALAQDRDRDRRSPVATCAVTHPARQLATQLPTIGHRP